MSYNDVDHRANEEASKKPLRQHSQRAGQPKQKTVPPRFKSRRFYQQGQRSRYPCRQPIIQERLARDPYQKRSECRQDAGPYCCSRAGKCQTHFVDAPQQKDRGGDVRKNSHVRSRMKEPVSDSDNGVNEWRIGPRFLPKTTAQTLIGTWQIVQRV